MLRLYFYICGGFLINAHTVATVSMTVSELKKNIFSFSLPFSVIVSLYNLTLPSLIDSIYLT